MTDYFPPDPSEGIPVTIEQPMSTVVPHSREAEEASVGVVLIDSQAYYILSEFLKADDFYIHRNKWIWEAYGRLFDKRIPVDILTAAEELDQAGQLAEIGGPAYLTALLNQVPTSLNAEAYGRIVEENAIRRRMIAAANKIASLAYKGGDIHRSFAEGKKAYEESVKDGGGFTTIGQTIRTEYDRIDARANGKDESIISTGFIDLDNILDGGLRGGNLFYLGGRPGMGKTGLLLDILLSAAGNRKRVALFSLEMSNEQVTQRIIAKLGVSMKSMRTGKLMDAEWPIFTHAVEDLDSLPIYMSDIPALSPTQLRSKAYNLHNRVGLDLLIVDYIGLMGNDRNSENRNNEVSEISRSLKVIARELNIPVLCAAQLNRKVEERQNKRPVLADLRDSGSLEQDGDIVGFLYRDEVYNKDSDKMGVAELSIAKQRDGETGPVELIFRGPLMKFENAALSAVASG